MAGVKSFMDPTEVAECGQHGADPRIAEAQAGSTLLRLTAGQDQPLERRGRGSAVLGLAFEGELATVDVPPDGAQRVEVVEQLADAKVGGVVDRGLGAQRTITFPTLLAASVAVTDLQRGIDVGAEDTDSEGIFAAAPGETWAAEPDVSPPLLEGFAPRP